MKCFALLCLVGVALASSGSSGSIGSGLSQSLWQEGQNYEFKYEARQLNGIPQLASQYSGMGIAADVQLQVTRDQNTPDATIFTIRIKDPRYVAVNDRLHKQMESAASVAQSNWRNVVLPNLQPVSGEARQQLEQPTQFRMHTVSGQFQSMKVGQQESDWAINFKKAIVVLFQTKSVNILGNNQEQQQQFNGIIVDDSQQQQQQNQMAYWTTTEEGLDGICSVDYQINELSNGQAEQMHHYFSESCRENNNLKKFVVTKTRNVDSCTKRNVFGFYKPGFFRCPNSKSKAGSCEGQWTRTSMTKYYTCGQSYQQMQIQSVLNEGELEQDLFGEKTERFVTGSQQRLVLISKRQINQHMQVASSGVKNIDTLVYGEEQKKSGIESVYSNIQEQMKSQRQHEPRSLLSIGHQQQQQSYQEQRQQLSNGHIQKMIQEVVQTVEQLVDQDLVQPQNRASKEITMKALNLARALYLFEQEELNQVFNQLKSKYQSQPQQMTTMKNVFFDTVIMAGSQNCVLFLKQKVQSQEVETQQLMNFFVFMPHYIITPTELVLENIFDVIKSDYIMRENQVIYNQAILSFSALVQRACLSQTRESSYPVELYGQFCSPKHQIVEAKWIPFLQQQVVAGQAQVEEKPEWLNLHLVALSNLRHPAVIPTILNVLDMKQQQQQGQETQLPQALQMTRYIAVYALSNAGQAQPQTTIQALATILKNQGERTEIRIAAFNALLKMNPELYVLQSIAAMTWRESNKDVIDVINSGFFFLAHQRDLPIFEQYGSSIQRKAALILPLLKWSRNLNQATLYLGDKLSMLDVSYSSIRSWRYDGTPSMIIPNNYYARLTYLLNRYQFVVSETFFKLNGYDNLIQQLTEVLIPGTQHKTKSQVGEKILNGLNTEWKQVIKNLNIERRDQPQSSQGALFMNFFEDFPMFASFQSTSSQMLREKLNSLIGGSPKASNMCGQHNLNIQRFMDLSPAEYSIPSELGLPILIEVHMPVTLSLKGQINVQCGQEKIVPDFTMDVRTLAIGQYVGYVGTVCPFTNEMLLTGVDQHTVLDLPFKTNVRFDHQQQQVSVAASLSQEAQNNEFDVIHFHVRPYTVRAGLYSLMPFSQLPQSQFKKIQSPTQPWSKESTLGQYSGLGLKVSLTTESHGPSQLNAIVRKLRMYNFNLLNAVRFGMVYTGVSEEGKPSLRSHLIKLTYNPQQNQIKTIQATVKLGLASKTNSQQQQLSYTIIAKQQQQQQQQEKSYPAWQQILPAKLVSYPISHQLQGHSQRQQKVQQIFQETGVQTGRVVVAEVDVQLIGSSSTHSSMKYDVRVCTGQTSQNLESKWNVQMNNQQKQSQLTIKGFLKPESQLPSMDIDVLRQNPVKYIFENSIISTVQGQTGHITINGNGQVSQNQIQVSRNSREAQEYEHIKQRNSTLAEISAAAAAVRAQATFLDNMDIELNFENMPKTANLYTVFGLTNIKAMWWPYKETTSQPRYDLNKLTNKWQLNFHQLSNTLSGQLHEQEEGKQIQFSEVQMPAIASYFFPINGQSLARFLKGQSIVPFHVQGESYTCQLYKDVARTYQSQVIPAQLDDCFHVMTGDYTKDYSFQILARALSKTQPQGAKELKVQYLNTNMVMTQSGPNNYRFIVNGTEQPLPHSTNMGRDIVDGQGNLVAVLYRNQDNGFSIVTVFERLNPRQGLVAVNYQGSVATVTVQSSLRGRLAGFCGQISSDILTDLTGPKKCIYSKPELLVASYRVSTQSKQCGPIANSELKNQLEQEQQQCKKIKHITSKVGASFQSQSGQCTQHVHLLLEKPSSVCISKRPVPQCSAICKPIGGSQNGLTEKKVSFVCLPSQSKQASALKSKVQQGQIVMSEISGLSSQLEMTMKLPRGCQAFSGINGQQQGFNGQQLY